MSTHVVTVTPGDLVTFNPSDKRTILFDFDSVNLAPGVQLTSVTATITAIRQAGPTALTSDNAGLLSGNRTYQLRLLATTATPGDRYRVAITGVTNETPVQEKNYAIDVSVQA